MSRDESQTPRQRFESIRAKHPELVADFIGRCQGGSLAWKPLMALQEDLCMEQLRAREELLRDELRGGKELPQVSHALRDAQALASMLETRPVPEWLRALAA